jgi:glycosyltransferase involved in cell wall biosynthesis
MVLKHLKVLHINKFHHMIGGAEEIYFRTADILVDHGHKSVFFSMRHPDNLPCVTAEYFMPFIDVNSTTKIIDIITAAARTFYSFKARRLVSLLLDRYQVDIVHIHDMHRQMSPSILHEFRQRRIPTVMTLHNYKMICPSFLMMSQNRLCEACDKGKYFNAMKLKCVKDSFMRSALISVEAYLHHKILNIYKNIDVFIAPSLFMKNKHEELGFKKEIIHLPNPIDIKKFKRLNDDVISVKDKKEISIVYFGRLTPEKGLFTLVDALKILSKPIEERGVVIKIIGEGPIKNELQEKVKKLGIKNVNFPGFIKSEILYYELINALVVILPSEWYENCPVSVTEAFALGKPVIGARIGGIPEMVKDYKTGLIFEPGNSIDLSEKVRYMLDNTNKAAEMGKNAKMFAEREFNEERYHARLLEIYKKALLKHK